MRFLTDRKRAQGLGSGRSGTEFHWQMLVSSIAMVVAVPLFIFTFGFGFGGTHEEVIAYFSNPFVAIIIALTMSVCILHFRMEVIEAIEDYVHGVPGRLLTVGTNALCYILIAIGLFALLKIAI